MSGFLDSLFPPAGQSTGASCSPLGAAVICVVMLVLFYFLLIKGKFASAPAGLVTGAGLRYQERSQGFTGGPEAPVFWGSSGGKDLANWNSSNYNLSETDNTFDPKNMDANSFNTGNNFFGRDVNGAGQVVDAQGNVLKAGMSGRHLTDGALVNTLY